MNTVKKVIVLGKPEVAKKRPSIGTITGIPFDKWTSNIIQPSISTDVSGCTPKVVVTASSPLNESGNTDGDVAYLGANTPTKTNSFKPVFRRASCIPSFHAWKTTSGERIPRNVFEQQTSPWMSGSIRRVSLIKSPDPGNQKRRKTMSENSEEVGLCSSFNMSPVFTSPLPFLQSREGGSQSIKNISRLSPCIESTFKAETFLFDEDAIHVEEKSHVRRRRKSNVTPKNRLSYATIFGGDHNTNFGGEKFSYRRNSIAICKLAALYQINEREKSCVNREPKYMKSLLKPLRLGTFIGKGGFGCVRVGLCRGRKVAIKQLKRITSIENEMTAFNFDINPRIVTTYAIVSCQKSMVCSTMARRASMANTLSSLDSCYFQKAGFSPCIDQKKIFILSELCSSLSLATLINSLDHNFPDRDKVRLLGQLAEALDYLHDYKYAHLDVKPSNCFLTDSGNLKLGDFGCCTPIGYSPEKILGTAAYQCPEILMGESATSTSDMYSWGITAWTLVTTKLPYQGLHPHIIIYKVTRLHQRPLCSFRGKTLIETLLIKIVQKCWDRDPTCRPTAAVIRRILSALYLQC